MALGLWGTSSMLGGHLPAAAIGVMIYLTKNKNVGFAFTSHVTSRPRFGRSLGAGRGDRERDRHDSIRQRPIEFAYHTV